MSNKMNLSKKILMMIGIPIIIAFCVTAVITLNSVNKSVTNLNSDVLSTQSISTSQEIEILFTKYLEVTKQMAANPQLEDLFLRTSPGTVITSVDGFPQVKKNLDNIKATDPDNIVVSWIGDIDSSQFTQSDGYTSGADYKITERGWYKDLVKKQTAFITEPYEDTATKKIIISVVAPVYQTGTQTLIGAACIDVSIDSIKAMLKEMNVGKTGFYIMTTGTGQVFYHPNEKYYNVNVSETKMSGNIKDALLNKTVGKITYTVDGEKIYGYSNQIGETGWMIVSGMPAKEYDSAFNTVRTTVFSIFGLIMLIVIALLLVMSSRITKPLKKAVYMIEEMGKGHFKERLKIESHDEIGQIAVIMNQFADKLQSELIATLNNISDGNVDIDIALTDQEDEITPALMKTIWTLKNLNAETESLIQEITEGKLNTRGNAEVYSGTWKELVMGINGLIDAFVAPFSSTSDYLDRISKGDIPPLITVEYKGDFNMIKDSINRCIGAVNHLIEDTNMLTAAASEGKFSTRADADRHEGDFGRIIGGINHTLDIIVEKIFWFESMLDAIPFPLSVTDNDMKWTFINQATTNAIGVKREDVLGQPCSNWNASICSTENCGVQCLKRGEGITVFEQGGMNFQVNTAYLTNSKGEKIGHIEIVQDMSAVVKSTNYNKTEVERLAGNLKNLSEGVLDLDFNVAEADSYTKQERENFLMINDNLKSARDAIQSITDDASMLTRAAIEGKLHIKADLLKYKGAWKTLVGGMNDILVEIDKPLDEIYKVMNAISIGDLSVSVTGSYMGDFDTLVKAVNATTDVLKGIVKEITDSTGSIADGNLAIERVQAFSGDFVRISDSLNAIIDSLNTVMGEISEAAEQVNSGSKQVSDGSQTLSQGATEQASAIQELTASVTEVAENTRNNAANAGEANELTLNVKQHAELGNQHMAEMLEAMTEISESSNNISKIIKVIDDIAFQTNILALNAAVEAARAGQHGKGFAVVAEEVRNLAARSAEAAKETTELISGSIRKSTRGTDIANNTAQALDEIVGGIAKTAGIIAEIARSSNDQATGVAQINTGLNQVSQVVQNNAATAEESAASSEELSGQAEMLKAMVGKFRLRSSVGSLRDPNQARLPGAGPQAEKKASSPRILLSEFENDKY